MNSPLENPAKLRSAAREIFGAALRRVDAGKAIRRAVRLEGPRLTLVDSSIDLATGQSIYVIAIGKAAPAMAAELDDILASRIAAGIISGPANQERSERPAQSAINDRWRFFAGGHPLPNRESLAAAQAVFELLQHANEERALAIFLISGGGSTMLEWPKTDQITLGDLRQANRQLVACGASIAEINAVRRAFSAVKGGGLAARAPNTAQVTLIISDTNPGDEASVASGPTMDPPAHGIDAGAVVARYKTLANLPESILSAINQTESRKEVFPGERPFNNHYVLLDNRTALEAAAEAARFQGWQTEIADDLVEQPIEKGCRLLLSRLETLESRASNERTVCLISGGEFLCPVRGGGVGGRNAETVLRWAIELGRKGGEASEESRLKHTVMLSAGTDGIDGNSSAAGAIADEQTIAKASALGLDAQTFLDASDAFTFFSRLGETITTGPTGTNVRDVRILVIESY